MEVTNFTSSQIFINCLGVSDIHISQSTNQIFICINSSIGGLETEQCTTTLRQRCAIVFGVESWCRHVVHYYHHVAVQSCELLHPFCCAIVVAILLCNLLCCAIVNAILNFVMQAIMLCNRCHHFVVQSNMLWNRCCHFVIQFLGFESQLILDIYVYSNLTCNFL